MIWVLVVCKVFRGFPIPCYSRAIPSKVDLDGMQNLTVTFNDFYNIFFIYKCFDF